MTRTPEQPLPGADPGVLLMSDLAEDMDSKGMKRLYRLYLRSATAMNVFLFIHFPGAPLDEEAETTKTGFSSWHLPW